MVESQSITLELHRGWKFHPAKNSEFSIVILFPTINKTLKCQNFQGNNILGEKLAWIDKKKVFILAQIFLL